MRKRGVFITFEGTDGVGKSTHLRRLASWLRRRGHAVIMTREPGGGAAPERIRKLLLDPAVRLNAVSELFLYEAARAEHVHDVIRPALAKRKVVLCDRFTDATVAYQAFGRGLPLRTVDALNAVAAQGLRPDLTLYLALPPREALTKAAGRSRTGRGDRLEREGLAFQKKVKKGYDWLLERHSRRIRRVSVRPRIEETQNAIRAIVRKRLSL